MASSFVRGATVYFTAKFFDKDGNAVTPDSATLYLTYILDEVETDTSVAMTYDSDNAEWIGSWESNVADPGPVEWHIRSSGGGKAAYDGSFRLTANTANPDP